MAGPVLVVDDDETLRESLVMLLEDEGYTVTQATDGDEALDVLRATPERMVVVLDFLMPRLNGDQVLSTASREPGLDGRHAFLLCSAHQRHFPPPFMELMRRLSVQVLPKPFDIEVLLAAVARAAARLDATA